MRLVVTIRAHESGWERSATTVDLSLAGVGIEAEELLIPGERVSVALKAPTLWDPLVIPGVVAWAHEVRRDDLHGRGRAPVRVRAGVAFDYPSADLTLALFEMLIATLDA